MARPSEIGLQHWVKFRSGQDYKHVADESGEIPVYGSGGPFATASDYLYDGESVLFGRKGTIDRPLHVSGKFWTVDTMFYTELSDAVDGRWLHYWATTIPFGLYSTDTALPSMTSSVLGRLKVPFVDVEDQRAIADYLDRETGEIDAMIAKMDELAETLEMRRIEMIKHTLVDGSTVCVLTPVFALATSEDNLRIPVKAEDRAAMPGEYPYYGASGVIDYLDRFIWDNETRVLVSEDGANLLARKNPIAFSASGRYWVNNHAHVLRPNASVDHRLVCYAFSITDVQNAITGSAQPKLTADALWRLKVPFPVDHHYSKELADHLDEVTGKIDAMLAKVAELKSLLIERRAALITDVVTGRKAVA